MDMGYPQFTCKKVGWDTTFKQSCCVGSLSDPLYCDPSWCPSDPQGECADVLIDLCKGPSTCGRHKMLTTDASLTGNVECYLWRHSIEDTVQLAGWSGGIQSVSEGVANAYLLIEQEIQRYCAEEGATTGECSCYNGYQDLQILSASGITPVFGELQDAEGNFLRHDAVCNAGDEGNAPFTSAGGKGFTLCNQGLSPYAMPTLNPASGHALPDTDPLFDLLPLHCWLPACQYSEDLVFRPVFDSQVPCPSVCYMSSGGATVNVNTVSNATFINIASSYLRCDFGGAQYAPLSTPFAVPDGCSSLQLRMPPNARATFGIPFTNLSQDTSPLFQSVSYVVDSSLSPMVSITGGGTGWVANGQTASFDVTVDTALGVPDQVFMGNLTIMDATGMNGMQTVPYALTIGNAGDAPTLPVDCGGTTLGLTRLGRPASLKTTDLDASPATSTSSSLVWIAVTLAVLCIVCAVLARRWA
jgi:hypothetical protein